MLGKCVVRRRNSSCKPPKDRIALITGANKGIGFEIARQLRKEGNRILIGARDRDRGQTAVADLKSEGFAAHYVQLDLTDLATITAAADIEAQEGRLDILVNNAGITSSGERRPYHHDRLVDDAAAEHWLRRRYDGIKSGGANKCGECRSNHKLCICLRGHRHLS